MTQNSAHTGKLYVVGTPIGNLGDLSPRVGEAFAAADAICCEDTRVTSKLLMHLCISKPLVRCDENVIASRAAGLVDRLLAGETLAFASDAGMPSVSDPGQVLVEAAREADVPVEVIPGPSACVTALVSSGIPCEHFFFEGFLDRKHGDRVRRLQRLAVVPGALIFYESPHRIVATLEAVAEVFPQREVAVCRELTKLHEEVLRGPAAQLAEELRARGEVKARLRWSSRRRARTRRLASYRLAPRQRIPTRPCARISAPRSRRGSPPLRWLSACLRSIRAASAMSMPWCSICNRWRISSPCARIIPVCNVFLEDKPHGSKQAFVLYHDAHLLRQRRSAPGTAYSTIIADVQARYRRSAGYNVKFLTGMDEHGEKVAEAAAKHGMTPQEWTDSQAPHFKELWSKLEISNDDFIRTTEPRQHHAVQYLWERMKESGYLYKGSYDGWYCVPDETYFTDTQVQKGDEEYGSVGQHLCPDCHRPLERVQEESYFFKLSAFQDKLLKLYDEHPDFVEPAFRMNEVRSFVEGGLNDLSVSRTSFDWGIQVPFDEGHVTYVWFDALLNYMTAVGYGVDTDEARAELAYRWPAQFHIVGKDIIRFHCVIWPAMLMAIGEALPEHVFAHGFLTVRNAETGKAEKMSKSRGNAIAPQDVIDMLGVEGYRYYFMTDVVPGTDGAISFDRMEQVYNADLANSWGNLISRSLNMSGKYFDGCAPAKPASFDAFENPLAKIADGLVERYMAKMDVLDYGGAKDEVMELIHAANHYIEDSEPGRLPRTRPS